jgi:hypothetical protein
MGQVPFAAENYTDTRGTVLSLALKTLQSLAQCLYSTPRVIAGPCRVASVVCSPRSLWHQAA